LQLKIAHDQYHLDQNPDALQVHIRDLIGPITCSRDFIRQFRRVRQGQPGFQPRLFIEFNGDDNEWKAVHFDGSNRSPSPGPSTSQAIPQFPNRGSAFTKYRSPKGLNKNSVLLQFGCPKGKNMLKMMIRVMRMRNKMMMKTENKRLK
jgi:hypothetical protein